eukprot:COSAG01_NODE_220_length_21453_cov_118.998361_9_plen_152_part_00
MRTTTTTWAASRPGVRGATAAAYLECMRAAPARRAGRNANGSFKDQSADANKVYWWQTFQLQLGNAIAPTVAFSDLDVHVGKMTRPYHEFLSVIGKPLGMRHWECRIDRCTRMWLSGPGGPASALWCCCALLLRTAALLDMQASYPDRLKF